MAKSRTEPTFALPLLHRSLRRRPSAILRFEPYPCVAMTNHSFRKPHPARHSRSYLVIRNLKKVGRVFPEIYGLKIGAATERTFEPAAATILRKEGPRVRRVEGTGKNAEKAVMWAHSAVFRFAGVRIWNMGEVREKTLKKRSYEHIPQFFVSQVFGFETWAKLDYLH